MHPPATSRTAVERAVVRERWLALGSLGLVAAACWAWIVPMATDMYGDMTGASAWTMTASWGGGHVALLFAMWTAMMVGMMLPSAAPTLLVYGMVARRNDAAAGPLLVVAGLYQLTPLKRACLGACQSPASFLVRHWRAGRAGAFRMGLIHGWYCLGCCWALMLLLFAGGVMNLAVIVGLTAFLLAEKLMPPVAQGGRFSGALLVAFGLYVAAGL